MKRAIHRQGGPGLTLCGLPIEGLRVSAGLTRGCPGCATAAVKLQQEARALWPFSRGARPPSVLVLPAPAVRGLLPPSSGGASC